jgi:hypothetical protein
MKRTAKFLVKLIAAVLLVAGIAVILYFTSPYCRAWMRAPSVMYHCTVTRDMPGEWCASLATLNSLQKGR